MKVSSLSTMNCFFTSKNIPKSSALIRYYKFIDNQRQRSKIFFFFIIIKMKRKYNKSNTGNPSSLKRAASQPHFIPTINKTIAEINHPSSRIQPPKYNSTRPIRVQLPEYFNIPKFIDFDLFSHNQQLKLFQLRSEVQLRKKLRDLDVLAEGMRRAKNIKQQSRYYFTQGVLQHNGRIFTQSIASFEKFLKIVLFIRDEKSVELALNAIGAEYMSKGDPLRGLEYHRKQGEINERADKFLSHANSGLCFEMAGDIESALFEYKEAQLLTKNESTEERKSLVKKLIDRVSQKKTEMFLTTHEQKINQIQNNQTLSKSPKRIIGKSSKINLAIRSAEQHMEQYLSTMKNSFILEKE